MAKELKTSLMAIYIKENTFMESPMVMGNIIGRMVHFTKVDSKMVSGKVMGFGNEALETLIGIKGSI